MRKPLFQLYLPFFAVLLGQALLVTLAPSIHDDDEPTAALTAPGAGAVGEASGGELAVDPLTGEPLTTGVGGTATGGTGTGVRTGPGVTGPTSGAVAASGDIRHCRRGRQHDIVYQAPPCVPKFTGNNGGSTYQGVTADKIKVVAFYSTPNEQVNAALAPSGQVQSREERNAFVKAAETFLNRYYEFYGRKLEIEVVEGDCPTTPPNIPACRNAAREVIAKKPFMVVWNIGLYSEVFNEWTRAGIPTIGGAYFDRKFFTDFRPYRYDANMDGTQAAELIAEYYCKKLAGKNATHSGQIIHSSIGARGQVRRKLGISVPNDPMSKSAVETLKARVVACDGVEPWVITYESDITRAQEQGTATTASYIQAKVTTVTCFCDALAPIFGGRAFTQQQYFPENLSSGIRGADDDRITRLYDEQQRAHGFGMGHQPAGQPVERMDATAIWRAAGNSGNACNACNGEARYFVTLGTLLQQAGPRLNPQAIEQGVVTNKYRRGGWNEARSPFVQLLAWGPNDYTASSDVRLTYWCETCRSPIDGLTGSSVALEGGRRFELGQLDATLNVPVAPQ